MRRDSVLVIDDFQNVFPRVIWDRDLTWVTSERPSPQEFFDYQTLLGSVAFRAGRLRLGVGSPSRSGGIPF
jgi:phthiodiolone/phenolphthiodiolone dimycocerosates ketoreductase